MKTETLLPPTVQPPFSIRWGFTTRNTPVEGLPPIRLLQVHGCRVHGISEASEASRQEGDGLWTRTPGILLGVRVADCVPILLAGLADGKPWVAALHAGWRGAVGGILRRATDIYRDCGGQPADLHHAFGPCIQACHFEVGEEVIEAARKDPAWDPSLAEPGPRGRPHLDLHGFLKAQAGDLGMDPAKDGSIRRCTYCEADLFHSYRRGDLDQRQWGFVEVPL